MDRWWKREEISEDSALAKKRATQEAEEVRRILDRTRRVSSELKTERVRNGFAELLRASYSKAEGQNPD